MLIEGRAVSLAQLSKLYQLSDINTVPYDSTTKKGKKYHSFQVKSGQMISLNDLV